MSQEGQPAPARRQSSIVQKADSSLRRIPVRKGSTSTSTTKNTNSSNSISTNYGSQGGDSKSSQYQLRQQPPLSQSQTPSSFSTSIESDSAALLSRSEGYGGLPSGMTVPHTQSHRGGYLALGTGSGNASAGAIPRPIGSTSGSSGGGEGGSGSSTGTEIATPHNSAYYYSSSLMQLQQQRRERKTSATSLSSSSAAAGTAAQSSYRKDSNDSSTSSSTQLRPSSNSTSSITRTPSSSVNAASPVTRTSNSLTQGEDSTKRPSKVSSLDRSSYSSSMIPNNSGNEGVQRSNSPRLRRPSRLSLTIEEGKTTSPTPPTSEKASFLQSPRISYRSSMNDDRTRVRLMEQDGSKDWPPSSSSTTGAAAMSSSASSSSPRRRRTSGTLSNVAVPPKISSHSSSQTSSPSRPYFEEFPKADPANPSSSYHTDIITTSSTPLSGMGNGEDDHLPLPSSKNRMTAAQYTGLGLGLPFTMSADPPPPTDPFPSSYSLANPVPATFTQDGSSTKTPTLSKSMVIYTSPAALRSNNVSSSSTSTNTTSISHSGRARQSSARSIDDGGSKSLRSSALSNLSIPESPTTDRSALIGLGELATPRWTSSLQQQSWISPESAISGGTGRRIRNRSGGSEEFDRVSFGDTSSRQQHDPMPLLNEKASAHDSPTLSRRTSSRRQSGNIAISTNSPGRRPNTAVHPSILFPSSFSKAVSDPLFPEAAPFPSMPVLDRDVMDECPGTPSSASLPAAISSGSLAENDSNYGGLRYGTRPQEDRTSNLALSPDHKRTMSGIDSPAADPPTSGSSSGYAPHRLSADRLSKHGGGSHRRQSASKSSFAHLPPSPAAPSTNIFSNSNSNMNLSTPVSLAASSPRVEAIASSGSQTPAAVAVAASPSTQSSTAFPSTRTPGHSRVSSHSFHTHSPSIIAASILRQTRDLEAQGLDVDAVAAVDSGTAEALRKLDGLSSPRLSKIFPSSPLVDNQVPAGEAQDSTETPFSSTTTSTKAVAAAAASPRRDSSETRPNRRTRNSTGSTSTTGLSKILLPDQRDDVDFSSIAPSSALKTPPVPMSAGPSPRISVSDSGSLTMGSPRAFASSNSATATSPASVGTTFRASVARSPLSPAMKSAPLSQSQRLSQGPYSYSDSQNGDETTFLLKRGSSSTSVSGGGATSTSATGSTSGTSFSSSFFTAASAAATKGSPKRRESAGSDASSIFTSGEGPAQVRTSGGGGDKGEGYVESHVGQGIPPVPPIPKGWDSYRSPTSSSILPKSTSTSTQNSPLVSSQPPSSPGAAGKVSDGSKFLLSTPMQAVAERASSSSSNASKTPPRKWSISSAFNKSSKSPNPVSPTGASDSTPSFAKSRNADKQEEVRTQSSLSSRPLPRRMAASTNDIASLATGMSPNDWSKDRLEHRNRDTNRHIRTASTTVVKTDTHSSSLSSKLESPNNLSIKTPGRSPSSLLSPRKTPSSGIPFFSRKGSGGSIVSVSPAPPEKQKKQQQQGESADRDEKSGRRSILGLSFLRAGGNGRKEKIPPSPQLIVNHSMSSSLPAADEFGRRMSVSNTILSPAPTWRKRTTTISGSESSKERISQPPVLPPLHMPKLSTATVGRVNSLTAAASHLSIKDSASSAPRERAPAPTRISKLQDSAMGNLPVILGSPSRVYSSANTLSDSRPLKSKSVSPPPNSTKIPRLTSKRQDASSPKLSNKLSNSSFTREPSGGSSRHSRRNSQQYDPNESLLSNAYSLSNLTLRSSSRTDLESSLRSDSRDLSTGKRPKENESGSLSRGSMSSKEISSSRGGIFADSEQSATALPRSHRRLSLIGSVPDATIRTAKVASPSSTISLLTGPRPQPLSSSASSTYSVKSTSIPKVADNSLYSSRRMPPVSASEKLSSSKSTRSITSKSSSASRVPRSATTTSLSSTRYDSERSSPSRSPCPNEEEIKADEEMLAYVRRQQIKKRAEGTSEEEIRKMFDFPDPTKPLPSMSANDATLLYGRYLSEYEKEEILDYSEIHFVGPKADKKRAIRNDSANNYGFDDERGDYLMVPNDHIRYRYEVIDVLGKGSFGQVLQCRDHQTGDMVAIKIIRNKKRFHHQALVEIKVLENLVKWDPDEQHYVIRMSASFTFRGHLCIVTELLSINLYELVKANSFAGFSTTLIRRFTVQILGSLSLLRHHRVVHCDLKPENILLKHPAKSSIKTIDFGSSCFEHEKVYTYIQSRFYRSPEVILGMNYHMAIDMWSLGCIIAEMFTGYPIFPGENEEEQLACIMEVMGLPEKYLVDKSSRRRVFFDSTGAPRPVVNSKGRRRRPGSKTLAQVLKTDDELFIDFIGKCLIWDPERRIKPDPALRHPWIMAARQRAPSPVVSSRNLKPFYGGGLSVSQPASSTLGGSPRKTLPITPTSMVGPVLRARTQSTHTSSSVTPRLSSKASLGLPTPSNRFSVKS